MPENMSPERQALLRALRRRAAPDARPTRVMQRRRREGATRIAPQNPTRFMPQQFNNPANPEVHRRTHRRRDARRSWAARARRLRRRRRHRRHHHRRRPGAARAHPGVRDHRGRARRQRRALGRRARPAPHPGHRRRLRARHPRPRPDHEVRRVDDEDAAEDMRAAAGARGGPAGRHLGRRRRQVAARGRARARPRQDASSRSWPTPASATSARWRRNARADIVGARAVAVAQRRDGAGGARAL